MYQFYFIMKRNLLLVVLLQLISFTGLIAGEKADIIVAKDGSGNFTNIQDALNSIPDNNSRNKIILIKNGIYREKIYIKKNFITLVGEDRDSTRIIYAELRKNWVKAHNSDSGSAVINIDSAVTNLTLANLTVYNNYGSLYNDHDHQFAIRGGGSKVIIINCNILADGGDTLSLWNRKDGMYYHSNCYFMGWVDYVCPRAWCYITDCKFYGYNLSASIWHDGSNNKDQKFVVRYSSFDGVPGFPLGRHHRDGQIYLLDCIFSRNMADKSIYLPISPNSLPWVWGERHYFYNCHREGGDFEWFKDNLSEAENSPKENEVTPSWTFSGKWDPEAQMPSVLPFVSFPYPRDGAYKIDANNPVCKWIPSRNAVSHNVYFGTEKNLVLRKKQNDNIFKPEKLQPKSTYYWRIDEVTETDTIKGPVWHFTTK